MYSMISSLLLVPAAAAFSGFGSAATRRAAAKAHSPHMSAMLHLYDPDSASDIATYLDERRCPLATSFDEAPKLAHAIALELDEALDGEVLLLPGGIQSIGLTCIISEAEDMSPLEACLSALGGAPESATVTPRDFAEDRLTGFCDGSDGEPLLIGSTVTLINGERIAGLQDPATRALQAIRDATGVMADELLEHFEFVTAATGRGGLTPVVYGGRAADGCIVGVLCMR